MDVSEKRFFSFYFLKLAVTAICLSFLFFLLHNFSYHTISHGSEEPFSGSRLRADRPDEAMRWFYEQRAYPTGNIPIDWKERALAQVQAHNLAKRSGEGSPLTWTALGPNNIGGRTRAIAVDPSNSSIIYAGSVSGGVWKSTNGGASWLPTDDFADNLAITSIVIDPSNSSIIYAATGEGFFNLDAVRGAGVLKSTNGGSSWTLQSNLSGAPAGFPYFINDIKIRSDSTNTLYAATNSGLFKTTNGGTSWVFIKRGATTNRATQILIDPST